MKVLHAAFMVHPIPGVMNQMQWELMAAAEHGMDWDTRLFCRFAGTPNGRLIVPAPPSSPSRKGAVRRWGDRIALHRAYFRWLAEQAPRYDAILLRYNASDPLQARFIRHTNTPVFPIHHTLEVPELRHSYRAAGRLIRVGLEQLSGRATFGAASGIVAVTDEILHYERNRVGGPVTPGYVYPNGIFYPVHPGTDDDGRGGTPEILFIASHFAHWHGLDLLLDSLEHSHSKFILHLVGTLYPADHARAAADPRIRLHGLLDIADVHRLSQRCWLGLSSFALERKQMEQACTLKVREYLLNGLPVYASHRDVFPDDFAYYRMGPPHIEQILAYARSIRSAGRREVAELARPFISKSSLLAGLHGWLETRVSQRSPQAAQPLPTLAV